MKKKSLSQNEINFIRIEFYQARACKRSFAVLSHELKKMIDLTPNDI